MSGTRVLLELVVVLGSAAATTVLFQALRLPVVLGYVLAGLVIGPHVAVPLVADPELVQMLSELGVILLLFAVGTELRVTTIARVGLPAALTTLFEVALVIVCGTAVARALGVPPVEALFDGACLGIASTMLVAKAFEERGWKGGFTDLVFAIVVFEDLLGIVLLAVLAAVGSGASVEPGELGALIGKLVGFLALLLGGGLIVVPRIVRFVARRYRTETLLVVSLAICFGAAALASYAGYSVALGAFIAGVLVAESGFGHEVHELVRPFRDVFATVFFVSVGMSIVPRDLLTELPSILAFTVVVLVVKPLAIGVGLFFSGSDVRSSLRAGLCLSNIGELSFVIAGLALSTGVARAPLLAIAVGIACTTTLLSGLTIGRSEQLANAIARLLPNSVARFESFYQAWLERLRGRRETPWRRLRRPIAILVLDVAVVCTVVIVAATRGPELADALELEGAMANLAIAGTAALLAAPFFVSLVRRIARIAQFLAREVIPARETTELDLGRAPRRSLSLMLALGITLLVALPMVAITQPFVPGGPAAIALVVIGLLAVARRSLRDLEGHIRAGSQVLLELMRHPEAPVPLAQVESVLPGFAGVSSLTLAPSSAAVGRSLAELDLRAKTGATVLAISRDGNGVTTPSPTEPLCAGDVLALAGPEEALDAARVILSADGGEARRDR